jgi:Rieske Fe-S protein
MSTELNFNNAEKTWDCPAHGGRYSTDGNLLEGPPKNPLKVLFRGKVSDIRLTV